MASFPPFFTQNGIVSLILLSRGECLGYVEIKIFEEMFGGYGIIDYLCSPMKAIVRLLFCCAVFSILACGGDSSFMVQLRHLDSLLIEYPDSVYKVLEGMEKESHAQSESSRMYYELLRADAQNKAYIDFTTDSVMLVVADYYDQHGTANEQMRAHYLLGCTYRDLNDVPMELQCFQEATEKADTTQKDCDLYTLVAIYGQMANIYDYQYLPEEELKALKVCEQLSLLDKDTLSAIKAYELRLRPYYLMNKQDSVLAISKEAYNRYKKLGYSIEAVRLLNPMIDILIKRNQHDEAWEYLNLYENNVDCNKDSVTIRKTAIINFDKGLLLLRNNKIDSALSCFNKLIIADEKEAAYRGLLSLYEKTNQPDSIAKYAKLFAEANDSSYVGMNSEVIAQMTAMYNYGRHEKIAKDKTIESANAKTIVIMISTIALVGFIMLMVAIAIMKRRSKERERMEKLLLKRYNETKDIISKLEKEKEALVTDTANIDQLLQTINRFESEKKELETKLKEFNQITDDVDFKAWYENFIDCNAANKLHAKTIISPNSVVKIEEDLWEELRKHIKRSCPGFLAILDAYSLNPTYEKIVLLNTFDFTNGEISILLDKTSQQISNIHNRLSKKMFPSSKETRKLKQNLREILRNKRV